MRSPRDVESSPVAWTGLLAPALALAVLPACELLQRIEQEARPLLPTVTYQGANLVRSPSQGMMAAYYCPQVVPDPFGVPGSAALACQGFFGAPPAPSRMTVAFDLTYLVQNPNHIPIPVAEMLTAVTVFPQKTNQRLGAVCVVFCGTDQPGCTGAPGPDSCVASETDIRSKEDFVDATADLLIATGVTVAQGGTPSFQRPEVVQDSEIAVTARFSFGPDPLLVALKEVARQSISQLEAGREITFEVPYRIEGTVWVDLGSYGKGAVGFGPAEGKWVIPTSSLGL